LWVTIENSWIRSVQRLSMPKEACAKSTMEIIHAFSNWKRVRSYFVLETYVFTTMIYY
jgi:hypothetical protein